VSSICERERRETKEENTWRKEEFSAKNETPWDRLTAGILSDNDD